jgi:chemotaxis protein CheC
MNRVQPLGLLQLDALREVANIGAGHAATALSEMTRRPVMVTVPRVRFFPISDAAEELGPPRGIFAGVILPIVGEVTGRTLILIDEGGAGALCRILVGRDVKDISSLTEIQASALKELGNILTSAYTNALSSFLNLMLLPAVPELLVHPLRDVLAHPLLQSDNPDTPVLCVETRFRLRHDEGGERQVSANFLLIPDIEALPAIFQAIHLEG